MRKRMIFLIALVVSVTFLISRFVVMGDVGKSEFEIIYSLKNSFDNLETVELGVVVNIRKLDAREMAKKIQKYYCELNENVDEVGIKLYKSKRAFEQGKYLLEVNLKNDNE